jgi:hypothetical protein
MFHCQSALAFYAAMQARVPLINHTIAAAFLFGFWF